MSKKIYVVLLILSITGNFGLLTAQSPYTLVNAISDAIKNAPSALTKDIIKNEKSLKISNIHTRYLPQISVQGQATYQSETTGLDINFPGFSIPRLAKDQYKVQMDASQLIYDGGNIAAQKQWTNFQAELENSQIDADIDQLKEQIIHSYFGLLEMEARLEMTALKKQDMTAIMLRAETAVNHGVMLSTELKNLKAEWMSIHQTEEELHAIKNSQLKTLTILTGREWTKSIAVTMPPEVIRESPNLLSKPMFKLFTIQKAMLDQANKLEMTMSKPKMLFFAQVGYGKPGLNFLENEFNPYYIGGLRLQWNINELYAQSKKNQITKLQKHKVEAKSSTYTQQIQVKLANLENEILKSFTQMKTDDDIINLRQEIKNAVAVKLEKGTATSAEYLLILNDVNEALINKRIHHLQYIKAGYLYNHHAGKGL